MEVAWLLIDCTPSIRKARCGGRLISSNARTMRLRLPRGAGMLTVMTSRFGGTTNESGLSRPKIKSPVAFGPILFNYHVPMSDTLNILAGLHDLVARCRRRSSGSRLIENLSYFLGQSAEGERLAQQMYPCIKPAVVDDRISCVTCCEQHLDRRMEALGMIGDISSVKAIRQYDVGKKKIDATRGFKESDCRSPIRRLENLITEVTKHTRRIGAQIVMVFYDKNSLIAV